jgi:hypothetical protein
MQQAAHSMIQHAITHRFNTLFGVRLGVRPPDGLNPRAFVE